ncbi:MAG: alkyl hydroperoxide reductase, partial [Chloroflexota bacterium]|nr:alkyl hydroperoxide reductase [Chloroflexota bacterium]
YIAMAGTHQLWSLDLTSGNIGPFAGSGRDGLSDGPLKQAWLAQPTGIDHDGEGRLYFADSETSAVRTASTDPGGSVETLVGIDLFDFGDRDGVGQRALLQHVQGVCYGDGVLYIADTYNSKIKRIDPLTKETTTLFGGMEPGLRDGAWSDGRLNEPSGVDCAGDRLYIADTNNHAIRVADLDTGEVTTLELRGL